MALPDAQVAAVVAIGMLSSMVLLASSSPPPSVTVSELWLLNEDATLVVEGVLVSLKSFESGAEMLVMCDGSGEATVKVICDIGPGQSPSGWASIGDLLEVSGDCAFEAGVPTVYCTYPDIQKIRGSEQALTVGLLCAAWQLFEGDRVFLTGESWTDAFGGLRLRDLDDDHSILMVLVDARPYEGRVVVECVPTLDKITMTFTLEVYNLTPTD